MLFSKKIFISHHHDRLQSRYIKPLKDIAMKPILCLLIDDDRDDHELFRLTMEKIHPSIVIDEAFDGRHGLQKILQREFIPDIIFTDLNMPLMDGLQFLQAFRALNAFHHIPVVMLSTSNNQESKKESLQLGAKLFLTKPATLAEWETSLRSALLNVLKPGSTDSLNPHSTHSLIR